MGQFNQLRGRVWAGVVLCSIALGGCSGSSAGPVPPPPPPPPPPPAAAKLAFIGQPSNAVAGAANTPAVQVAVQDAQGKTVTTATTSITVAIGTNPASGTLAGTTTVAAVNGVATFSTLSLDRAAAGYTLTASAASLASATSSAFSISAAAAAKLVFTVQPSTVAAGAASTPAVQVAVQDALGNTVTTSTSSITMAIGTNPASGTLSGTMTVAAISGVATFSTLSLDKSGTGYTLTAAASGLTGATSNAFNVVASVSAGALLTISAGYYHSCGVTPGGAAYCWGENSGELGNGTNTDSPTPVAVSGGLTFASISAGFMATCGVTTSGAAYCWGDNYSGEGGTGTTGGTSYSPVAVSGGLTLAAVSAGYHHTCAVTPAGTAYCWGYNSSGALGNGTTTSSAIPVAVSGGLTFAAVRAGNDHTCGVTPSGAAY